jgi:HlyD family secretion protein
MKPLANLGKVERIKRVRYRRHRSGCPAWQGDPHETIVVKKLLFILVLMGLLLAGVAYWFSHGSDAASGIAFTTRPVEYGALVETVNATGLVQPERLYIVGAEAQGRVVEVRADFNQEVEEGAVLLRLDDRVARQKRDQAAAAVEAAQRAVEQAEVTRDAAHRALERERSLPAQVQSPLQVEALEGRYDTARAAVPLAEARVKEARQALDLAELPLKFTVVRAPVLKPREPSSSTAQSPAGVGALATDEVAGGGHRKFLVLDRKVSLGQVVGPPLSSHLFTLAGDLSTVHVEAQVAEGDVSKVAVGLEAAFTISSAGEDVEFHARVTEVRLLPVNDRGAVFYKVILKARNERNPATGRWWLSPGMTTDIDIVCRKHEHAWKMPGMALSFQPEDSRLTPAARDKLRRWQANKNRDLWQPVWVVGPEGNLWPLFVRVGGKKNGERGIRDLSFTEVLEWDPELNPPPEPGKPSTYPPVIIAAPEVKSGLFNPPNIKL